MKIKNRFILIFIFSLFSLQTYAEPPNLSLLKNELKVYHDKGIYQKELGKVIHAAHVFVEQRIHQNAQAQHRQKLAVVLDIDETSISNYDKIIAHDFSDNPNTIHHNIEMANSPAIKPMLSFYKDAYKQGVAIFFVTGRHESYKTATIKNLINAGYHHWAGLYLKPDNYHQASAMPFKSHAREEITQQGYTIIASIGDQQSDLKGGYAEKTFKLPNPYYYVP